MTSILIRNADTRRMALDAVRSAPEGVEVVIRARRKTRDQESLFHARLSEFAKSKEVLARWGSHSMDEWKDEIVRATFGLKVRPSLFDPTKVVVTRLSTTGLSLARYSDLIETLYMIGAEVGHVWEEFRPGDAQWEAQQEHAKRAAALAKKREAA